MHTVLLSTGAELNITEESYQFFLEAIGSGPRFIELELTNGQHLICNKDHIVSIVA